MSLTVGELSAILKVENRQFEDALKSAKKAMERAAAGADELGDEAQSSFNKGAKAADKMGKEIKDITKNSKKAENPMGKLGKTIGTAFKVGVIVAFGKQIADVTMQMANLALEAQESAAAFEITFGSAAKETTRFVNEMAHAFGMTKAEMQQQMAVTGSVIQGLGFTSDAAAGMSENILSLSGDLAAFMNIQEGAVVPAQAITKALTGEREMLKSMGIVLRQTEVDQKALNMTGKAAVGQLTDQEKAAASLVLIEEKMGHIKGQLAREAEGAANQMRQLRAEFKEAQTEVGAALLPAFATFIPVVRELIPTFKEVMATVAKVVQMFMQSLMPAIEPIKEILSALMPIVEGVAGLLGGVLKTSFEVIATILNTTLIPILNGLSDAVTFVMNTFGILTSQQEEYLRSAETAEGVLFRLKEAIAAGIDPQEAFNAAMSDANDLGIEQEKIFDEATGIAYGFGDAINAATEEEIKLKKAQLEAIESGKQHVHYTQVQEDAVNDLKNEIEALEQEQLQAQYQQYSYIRAQAHATEVSGEYEEATEEATDAVAKQSLELDKNTQAKLQNNSVSNEAVSAMLNLVNAVQRVTEIQSRETVEQEKLNKLLEQRTKLQKIFNEEQGKGEVQTEAELAQIEKLRAKEAALIKQQNEGLDLALDIAGAELDLADAKAARAEKGEKADARDDLSVRQAEHRLKSLRDEQANSKDVTIELAQVQESLQSAIDNSTKATQAFITAERGLERLDTQIAAQREKTNDAAIDTTAEQLELAEAKLAMEAALLTAQDKNVLKESRATLSRVLGLDTAGVNKLFEDLGLDTSAFKKITGKGKENIPFDPQTEQAINKNNKNSGNKSDKEAQTETTTTNTESIIDFMNRNLGGAGGATLGHSGKAIVDDSMFDLGNANSVASQFLKERNETIVNVNIEPSLDAEARVDKTMNDINDRIQVRNRFRAL